ncbi:hypothetical protein Ddye_031968 [Dipteronia dyeriana]|uniref:beta-N-acetylhexosaminidase n=1 Tax=Dipteronia dyeriana TaxID=168575 RepID=A0AAD9TK02_9ROSI|nr:hypothetical protein Ddye_031968 [Dipteronia dyeriana]
MDMVLVEWIFFLDGSSGLKMVVWWIFFDLVYVWLLGKLMKGKEKSHPFVHLAILLKQILFSRQRLVETLLAIDHTSDHHDLILISTELDWKCKHQSKSICSINCSSDCRLSLSCVVISQVWVSLGKLSGINVWPQPQATLISPNFIITNPEHPYLSSAVNRYLNLINYGRYQPQVSASVNITNPPLLTLSISVDNLFTPLHHGVDESYTLTIPANVSTANLNAQRVWGAMRGLETFSQLVWGKPSLVAVGLGLMLDTSRNYYGVDDILRAIAAMSGNKMNVFHWHITDSHSLHSFPLVIPSEPDLAAKGSYDPQMQYSPDDVKNIVQFGLAHGVRVLPKIDSPGSWAEAYPEIVTCANMFRWPAQTEWADRLASEPGGTGHLNPLNPKTFQVLKNVITDVVNLFPEPFYHAGADEIIPGCWKADPTIRSFLSKGGSLSQVLEKFVNITLSFIVSLNRTVIYCVIYWEDVLLNDLVKVDSSFLPPEHTILQTWNNGPNNTKRIVKAGYRAIVSSSEFYYLDCGHIDFLGNDCQYDQPASSNTGNGGSWCGPFKTWQTIYNYGITYGLSEEEAKLVVGGEVALFISVVYTLFHEQDIYHNHHQYIE